VLAQKLKVRGKKISEEIQKVHVVFNSHKAKKQKTNKNETLARTPGNSLQV